ncbi:ParA family protein [Polaromonas sp. JS666]|uniref:ParA family protein n=1 Tax=Polaromonas sp. (strain JS666 / ATCC BAA-500) TaxID=296591 RepID=UPI0000532C94|nr:ParA family protein [Polaromonas sp. JS666]ABE47368.1 Cobyrinic acid a,c-diamide synthase [Polaromonas sp. JS666]
MANKQQAKIITVFNEKGGSGKTTTTCQLSGTLGIRGFDVLVGDLDPQESSAKWLAQQGGVNFKATLWSGYRYGENINTELEKLSSKYEIIVLDCAPSVEQPATWQAILVSDLVLIPTKLNPPDLDALPAAKLLAKRAIEISGRNIPVRVVPVSTRMHMIDDRTAVESLRRDSTFPPLAQLGDSKKSNIVSLGDRKAFTRSMLVGATAHSLKGSEDSVREIEGMADSILKLLDMPNEAVVTKG